MGREIDSREKKREMRKKRKKWGGQGVGAQRPEYYVKDYKRRKQEHKVKKKKKRDFTS